MMALIKCSECGKEISDKAEYCVNCGCPISEEMILTKLKCPECNCKINENTEICQNCGFPIIENNKIAHQIQGKATFITSNDFIGLMGKYTIKDKNNNTVAKLRANDCFEIVINEDSKFYIRYSGAFTTYKEVTAYANQTNSFVIGLTNGGCGFYVNKK